MTKASGSTTQTVVVSGDLLDNVSLVQYEQAPLDHYEPIPKTILQREPGGAWLFAELIRAACVDLDLSICAPERSDVTAEAYSIWALHEREAGRSEPVWRIREFLGCNGPPRRSEPPRIKRDVAKPDVLALDDLGLGFRDDKNLWPKSLREGGRPEAIVFKTCSLAESSLWKVLVGEHADRTTVVIDVEALRARRAAISRAVSWDLAVEEIVREFQDGSSAHDLGRCRRVIVAFGSAGAATFSRIPPQFERPGGRRSTSRLGERVRFERFLYHPHDLEGSWEAKHPGLAFGDASFLAATVARHELRPDDYPIYIALGRALAALRVNHEEGGGPPGGEPRAARNAIAAMLCPGDGTDPAGEPAATYRTAFPHDALDDPDLRDQPGVRSDLLQDVTGSGLEYVAAKATEVVLLGPGRALAAAPSARYGKFFTVDRQEIERINVIRNLILAYRANPADRRPLSVGVFGPPGSGKSFAIKQLAKDLFGPGKALEFNLSQIEGTRDLHTAFHQVRDASMQGKLPIVFWDEFDTGDLRWLKEFLAPMQDAEFRSAGMVHPLGKAIFVFAGGIAHRFEEFDKSRGPGADTFRPVKGPDFVSRLRGFVNIRGPNPTVTAGDGGSSLEAGSPEEYLEAGGNDPAHLVRRAIMLRVVLERLWPHLIDRQTGIASISTSVIRAFLWVRCYLHGARSLESVVNMSDLTGVRHFATLHLPCSDLLRLHVTSDFLEHVRQAQLETDVLERLAEAYHEGWRELRETQGWKCGPKRDDAKKEHPLLVPYAELSPRDKGRNRAPARLTQARLLFVGFRIIRAPGSGGEPSHLLEFSDDELDRLARAEHDRWLKEKLLDGYEWGPTTNEGLRMHPDIAPFESVGKDRELDRAQIQAIPPALLERGYMLVRAEDAVRASK